MKVILRSDQMKNKKYIYTWESNGKEITDIDILNYIKKLVIPPAYKNVNIFYPGLGKKDPKILYMGIDNKNRPQFIYSKWWSLMSRELKFCTLIKFGEALPEIKKDIKNNILTINNKPSKVQIISLILRIISMCYFRIGNVKYSKTYNSYGISTIHKKHVKVINDRLEITFIGKKGVLNTCNIVDKLVIKHVQRLCTLFPKGYIFQYYDNGYNHIKHTDINNFLKKYNPDFTSKLFRTYDTNILLISRFINNRGNLKERKKTVIQSLKEVSEIVHNTPAICKKDYADPDLIKEYIEHPTRFDRDFNNNDSKENNFMKWLKKTKKC